MKDCLFYYTLYIRYRTMKKEIKLFILQFLNWFRFFINHDWLFTDKIYSVDQDRAMGVQQLLVGGEQLFFVDNTEADDVSLNFQMKVYVGKLINTYFVFFLPSNKPRDTFLIIWISPSMDSSTSG